MGGGKEKEMRIKGQQEIWGDGNVHHLDCGDELMGMYTCQNSSTYAI